MEARYEMLVNGKMTGGSRSLDVINPATAEEYPCVISTISVE